MRARSSTRTSAVLVMAAAAVIAPGAVMAQTTNATTLPQLFMSLSDASNPWGRMTPRAMTVRRQPNITTPVASPLAAFNVRGGNGTVEVFGLGPNGLWRWVTEDFQHWSSREVLNLVAVGKHCCEAKSIARDERTGRYVFLAWQAGYGGHSFVSMDGIDWNITSAHIKAHDDANIIFQGGRFVDMQILKQKLPGGRLKRYCDNTGCAERRVITALTSADGITFSAVNGSSTKNGTTTNVREPDSEDPEELEFYRIRPFRLSGSDRLAAHVLLYAPSPTVVHQVNSTYGIYTLCDKHNRSYCHGPHIRDEWWVLPAGGDAAAVGTWERPYRDLAHPATPRDVSLMAQPVITPAFPQQHVWVDQGQVFTLPQFRLGGLHSYANAEFSSREFDSRLVSSLWLNVDAKWHQSPTARPGELCDEGCAAYVMAELYSADDLVNPLPGFERQHCTMFDVNDVRVPLTWKNAPTLVATKPVVVRLFFRDATVFALGAGGEENL